MRIPIAANRELKQNAVSSVYSEDKIIQQQTQEKILDCLSCFFGQEWKQIETDATRISAVTTHLHSDEQRIDAKADSQSFDDNNHFVKGIQRHSSMPATFKSSLKNSDSSRSLKHNVSFNSLSIREYSVEIGDNPSCSFGIPISLGWDYEELDELPLDDAKNESEDSEKNGCSRRKKSHELLLSYNDRRRLLKKAGYSKQDIDDCMRSVRRTQRERGMTEFFLAAAPIEDAMESFFHNIQIFFSRIPS
jgi:hypothetical protein